MIRVYNSENGCVHVGFIDWWGLAHADEPFPLPCPLVNPLHRRIRRPHPDPLPSLPPSFPHPLFLSPMRLSSPPFTHTALFFFPPPPPSPPWIWVRGSGSDSTSQNHPPDPTLPPSFVTIEAWACPWTVCVCGGPPPPPDSVTWHTERLHCWTSRFAWNAGFASHSCGRDL